MGLKVLSYSFPVKIISISDPPCSTEHVNGFTSQ